MTDSEKDQVLRQLMTERPPPPAAPQVLIVGAEKSMGMGVVLAIIFGPLGLIYASPWGGLLLLCLTFVVGLVTFGLGIILGWLAAIIWAVVAVGQHNDRLRAAAAQGRVYAP